ncbi:MAG: EI24 domain-containing protein [Rudaea sp.]
MAAIFGALRRALPILAMPRIVALATLPLVVAAILWTGIGMAAWHPLTDWLAQVFGAKAESSLWQRIAADAIAVVMFAALAVITAFTAIAVLSMPVIVRVVAMRDFPALQPLRGGSFSGSVANAAVALVVYVPLWLMSLPLLFIPPLYAVVSLVLNAWLTQRMFRYDALAEHARREEIAAVLARSRTRLMGLGLVLSPLSLIPLVNILVLPIYAGIAFTELALGELTALRASSSLAAPA